MSDHLWRLAWALPLVLCIGFLALLWLRKLGVGTTHRGARPQAPEVHVVSQTSLTDKTQLILIEVDGERYLITESSAQIAISPCTHPGSSPWAGQPIKASATRWR